VFVAEYVGVVWLIESLLAFASARKFSNLKGKVSKGPIEMKVVPVKRGSLDNESSSRPVDMEVYDNNKPTYLNTIKLNRLARCARFWVASDFQNPEQQALIVTV
jgi:hypothetical protein